jgi:hypothetical protein
MPRIKVYLIAQPKRDEKISTNLVQLTRTFQPTQYLRRWVMLAEPTHLIIEHQSKELDQQLLLKYATKEEQMVRFVQSK